MGWALKNGYRVREIKEIYVHWSASDWGDASVIRGWHLGKGFSDIGYHKVILNGHRQVSSSYKSEDDGLIEDGRPEETAPAATKGFNKHSLAVCLIANKETQFTMKQVGSLVYLLKQWCHQYNLPLTAVKVHRDTNTYRKAKGWGTTECPGFDSEDLLKILRG